MPSNLNSGAEKNISVDESWLRDLNERFRREGVEPGQRPWLAEREFAIRSGVAVTFGSPESDAIFRWFAEHAPSQTAMIGPLLLAAYYFDARFWPLDLPVFFGTCRLEPLASLRAMPQAMRLELAASGGPMAEYLNFWLACLDYACSAPDGLNLEKSDQFGGRLFRCADAELNSTVAQLLGRTPNPRAAWTARMATELFLKSFAATRASLTEDGAKKIGHDLGAAARVCLGAFAIPDLKDLQARFYRFPAVGERYDDVQLSREDLWACYAVAQLTGTAVVRTLVGRDSRNLKPAQ